MPEKEWTSFLRKPWEGMRNKKQNDWEAACNLSNQLFGRRFRNVLQDLNMNICRDFKTVSPDLKDSFNAFGLAGSLEWMHMYTDASYDPNGGVANQKSRGELESKRQRRNMNTSGFILWTPMLENMSHRICRHEVAQSKSTVQRCVGETWHCQLWTLVLWWRKRLIWWETWIWKNDMFTWASWDIEGGTQSGLGRKISLTWAW